MIAKAVQHVICLCVYSYVSTNQKVVQETCLIAYKWLRVLWQVLFFSAESAKCRHLWSQLLW